MFLLWKNHHFFQIDSYSAFYDNGGFTETDLNDRLNQLEVDTVYITGLALDFCVFYSAMDAKHLGFQTFVVQDATRGITPDGVAEALEQMKSNDITIIQSTQISQGSGKIRMHFSLLLLPLLMSKI